MRTSLGFIILPTTLSFAQGREGRQGSPGPCLSLLHPHSTSERTTKRPCTHMPQEGQGTGTGWQVSAPQCCGPDAFSFLNLSRCFIQHGTEYQNHRRLKITSSNSFVSEIRKQAERGSEFKAMWLRAVGKDGVCRGTTKAEPNRSDFSLAPCVWRGCRQEARCGHTGVPSQPGPRHRERQTARRLLRSPPR